MKNEKDRFLLRQIADYCEKIEATVARFGNSLDALEGDSDYLDSVCMNILQIGEIAGRLSEAFQNETSDRIDWRAIRGMRNIFAHNYGSVDPETVFHTVSVDLPVLKAFCLQA